MFTVALIGPDGAGKTTIATKLLESFPQPMKYLYMGLSIQSSNVTLPTSKLILYLKLRSYKRSLGPSGNALPEFISNHELENQAVERGKISAAARLLNRLAEEWFRQIVAWIYQLRGYIVLYDRHFLFEYATQGVDLHSQNLRLSDRLHLWSLQQVYPQPDLTIFLDAPPEVLLSRKNECSLDHLQRERAAYLEQGQKITNFVRVDATRPAEWVLAEVSQLITQFHTTKHLKKHQAIVKHRN